MPSGIKDTVNLSCRPVKKTEHHLPSIRKSASPRNIHNDDGKDYFTNNNNLDNHINNDGFNNNNDNLIYTFNKLIKNHSTLNSATRTSNSNTVCKLPVLNLTKKWENKHNLGDKYIQTLYGDSQRNSLQNFNRSPDSLTRIANLPYYHNRFKTTDPCHEQFTNEVSDSEKPFNLPVIHKGVNCGTKFPNIVQHEQLHNSNINRYSYPTNTFLTVKRETRPFNLQYESNMAMSLVGTKTKLSHRTKPNSFRKSGRHISDLLMPISGGLEFNSFDERKNKLDKKSNK